MKKVILIGGAIVLILVAGFVIKNISRKPMATVEQSPVTIGKDELVNTATKEGSGAFVDGDAIHKGSGTATIYRTETSPILKFEDFSVTIGPDLFVYLTKNDFRSTKQLGEFVSLGNLKSTKGDQIYNLPADYQDFKTVLVWCRAFGVLFTYAPLE